MPDVRSVLMCCTLGVEILELGLTGLTRMMDDLYCKSSSNVRVCVCVYIYIYVCVCVYVCIYIYIYIYMQTLCRISYMPRQICYCNIN